MESQLGVRSKFLLPTETPFKNICSHHFHGWVGFSGGWGVQSSTHPFGDGPILSLSEKEWIIGHCQLFIAKKNYVKKYDIKMFKSESLHTGAHLSVFVSDWCSSLGENF